MITELVALGTSRGGDWQKSESSDSIQEGLARLRLVWLGMGRFDTVLPLILVAASYKPVPFPSIFDEISP